jgi:hypothetical protein
MKASRAPGKVQSTYVQRHQEKAGKSNSKEKKQGPANNIQNGKINKMIDLDAIPDFPNTADFSWDEAPVGNASNYSGNDDQYGNEWNVHPDHQPSHHSHPHQSQRDRNHYGYYQEEDENEYIEQPQDHRNHSNYQLPQNHQQQNSQHHVPLHNQFQKKVSMKDYHDSSGEEDNNQIDGYGREFNYYGNRKNDIDSVPLPKKKHPSAQNSPQRNIYDSNLTNSPPPLPCDNPVKSPHKVVPENEKLFYSKQPRAVEYKCVIFLLLDKVSCDFFSLGLIRYSNIK